MIVSINQPAYLPWPGYFDRIAASDLHVVLDHVQFEKNSLVNRNKILARRGWAWLTVPIKTSGFFKSLPINEIEPADNKWPRRHMAAIRASYARAPYFPDHYPFLSAFYSECAASQKFLPVATRFILYTLDLLAIRTPLVASSQLECTARKSDLVLEICRKVGASEYLSGPFGRVYLDLPAFRAAGIKVSFHDYATPPYQQRWEGFEPNLSIVDLLMNRDAQECRNIIPLGRTLSQS